jgi:cyclase
MLKKRIIPCLDIQNGRTVKGVNFMQIKDAGDPVALAKQYAAQGADELVFLDISATQEKRKTLRTLVQAVAKKLDIPFTVGGGISSVRDAAALLKAGADKISINSSAVGQPKLISQMAEAFGSQCVVVAIDAKWLNGQWKVCVQGGKIETHWKVLDWAKKAAALGAGELLLTSMQADGTKKGFSVALTRQVSAAVNIPVIASGGAGELVHFQEVFTQTHATGALAASIFHYGQVAIPDLKTYLFNQQIPVRLCN